MAATTSNDTVTVSLKHPHGLILRLYDMVETPEAVMGGGTRTVKQARFNGRQITINGYSQKNSSVPLPHMAGAFAMTPDVPKDFWDEWVKQNHDHPYLQNNIMFASPSVNYATGKEREYAAVKSGLEPLDPDNLKVKGVETYERDGA